MCVVQQGGLAAGWYPCVKGTELYGGVVSSPSSYSKETASRGTEIHVAQQCFVEGVLASLALL